jgi:hypothetical protein
MTKRPLLAIALLLPACAALPASMPPGPPPQSCPIIGSSDWQAWVDAMPGPGNRPHLIVTGKVVLPTGGWRVAWRDMRVMESYPVQVAAELDLLPPPGPATQAITSYDVRGSWPIQPPVGSVSVSCGGTVIARIAPVVTAL